MLLFNVAFVVVLMSLVLQGATIGVSARLLGVALPDPADARRARVVFGDFVIDACTPVKSLCEFYELPEPANSSMPLGIWLASVLGRTPILGDHVQLGAATLIIRGIDGGNVTLVGLKLP